MRPFHCVDCYERFYGHPGPINVPQLEASVAGPQPKWPRDQAKLESLIPLTCVPVERRAFSRLRCQIPARLVIDVGPRVTGGIVSDISLSGCFVEMPNTVPVGSAIELSLEGGEVAHSRGLVRRSLPAKGLGIEFLLMTAPNFRRIQSIAKDSVRLH
jgi:PilZ domain